MSESCPRGPELTEEFEFDSSSRVVARVGRVRDDPHVYRSEFEYDDAGNVLVQREAIDGVLDSTWMCEYDSRGRLLSRYTFDLHVDPTRNRRASQRIEETFDGIDRPLIKRIYDLRGKLEDVVIWDYVFDDRGNWIRKTDFNIPVMRKIEYAD